MGLLTIIRKVKRNERELRVLLVCVICLTVALVGRMPFCLVTN